MQTHLMAEGQFSKLSLTINPIEEDERAILKALTTALELRDPATCRHSVRVLAFSLCLGRELKLDETRMRWLEFGALLHDIGKIGVADSILRKPTSLTDEEWKQMRHHPVFGEQILRGINFLVGASRIVGQHHERWDGAGYPYGLSRTEIDLNARILSVADAFDAIISDRPYRAARTYAEAIAELKRCAGRQFDPQVVEAFCRIPQEVLLNSWQDESIHDASHINA